MIGFAIGNGLSRADFDLKALRGRGPIVGCNALYTEFTPHYLVALDWPMILELRTLRQRDFVTISRDARWANFTIDDEPFCKIHELNGKYGRNSGIVACAFLAKFLQCKKVYMIGFDFFTYDEGDETNDVYGRLNHFNDIFTPFNKLFARYPDTTFVRVGPWRDEYTALEGLRFESRLRDR